MYICNTHNTTFLKYQKLLQNYIQIINGTLFYPYIYFIDVTFVALAQENPGVSQHC